MKILKNIGYVAIVLLFFAAPTFESNFSSWRIERRNKKISEEELQRLVNEFGLNKQNTIEDLNECGYRYVLYEEYVKIDAYDMGDKKLKEKDIFMVKCIPLIQELLDKCEDEREEIDKKYPYEIVAESMGDKCERDVLDTLVIDK